MYICQLITLVALLLIGANTMPQPQINNPTATDTSLGANPTPPSGSNEPPGSGNFGPPAHGGSPGFPGGMRNAQWMEHPGGYRHGHEGGEGPAPSPIENGGGATPTAVSGGTLPGNPSVPNNGTLPAAATSAVASPSSTA